MAVASSILERVRLPPDVHEALERVAAHKGMSKSEVMRQGILLMDRLDRRERAMDELIALADIGVEDPPIKWSLR